jgi:hypothetical protein
VVDLSAIYKEDLDRMQCACEDCKLDRQTVFYLHSRCHLDAPTWAVYDRKHGVLRIVCSDCGKAAVAIKVASKEK